LKLDETPHLRAVSDRTAEVLVFVNAAATRAVSKTLSAERGRTGC